MSRSTRLLFVISSLDRGGAERQIVDVGARLHAGGMTVAVLSMMEPGHHADELRDAGVEVATLNMARGRPSPAAFVRYGQFVQRWRPEIIHSHMVHANLLARVGRVFAPRVPVICTVHSVTEGARWREVAYRLTDWLATRTTAVSDAAARRYIEVGAVPPGRILVVPNGFDFAKDGASHARFPTRSTLGVTEEFLWVAAGRLHAVKGFDLLLDAFARVHERRTGSRLVIAGEGPERDQLQARLSRLGLEPVAALLGYRPDLPAVLAAADGFVLSSHLEGLPMVLLEAAAARLPIVATDVGGNSDVVRPELGGILTGVNPAEIARGMERVMAMAAEERARVGGALREHVREGFDIVTVVAQWRALYARFAPSSGRS